MSENIVITDIDLNKQNTLSTESETNVNKEKTPSVKNNKKFKFALIPAYILCFPLIFLIKLVKFIRECLKECLDNFYKSFGCKSCKDIHPCCHTTINGDVYCFCWKISSNNQPCMCSCFGGHISNGTQFNCHKYCTDCCNRLFCICKSSKLNQISQPRGTNCDCDCDCSCDCDCPC